MGRFYRHSVVVAIIAALILVPSLTVAAEAESSARFDVASVQPTGRPETPADKDLASRSLDFESFAKQKVVQLNSNHRLSRSRMEVVKQADGTYRARYHEIDTASLGFKVRRSQSRTVPFVGVLSYSEQVFESTAASPGLFDKSRFDVVQVIPNRHIFSFQKGHWN